MGIAKRLWMERMEDEYWDERAEWIREKLNDPDADEYHPRWATLSDEFDAIVEPHGGYDDDWTVPGKPARVVFDESMDAILVLREINLGGVTKRNLSVMLFAHAIATLEGYLSSTFITTCLGDEKHIQALVKKDKEFAERKLSMKEIFARREGLSNEIGAYLKEQIFHNVIKVRTLYKNVLGIDLGAIDWLEKAVRTRHDCVHRAGYTKDGEPVEITDESLRLLVTQCQALAHHVDDRVLSLIMPEWEASGDAPGF